MAKRILDRHTFFMPRDASLSRSIAGRAPANACGTLEGGCIHLDAREAEEKHAGPFSRILASLNHYPEVRAEWLRFLSSAAVLWSAVRPVAKFIFGGANVMVALLHRDVPAQDKQII